jgi:hypothetical protein
MTKANGTQIPIAPVPAQTGTADIPVGEKYALIAIDRLEKSLGPVSRMIADVSHPVDEYATESVLDGGVTTVTVYPEYDKMAARIECVIVTGPPSTAFSLQLGDRAWTVLTDASGKFQVFGSGMLLGRNDQRILTSTTPGNWTLELTGFADERYYAP